MLNPTKCKAMTISRKRNSVYPAQFLLNGIQLEQVFKYLGVLFSSNISWSAHIDSICTKARKVIDRLYRRFYGNVDNHSLLELYSVLVRPHLEYAAPIWAPHLIKDTNKLENVQIFAIKMCLKQWNLGYQDLLDRSQFPTLKNHRLYLKFCTLYKIMHGYFYFPHNVFLPQVNRHSYSLPLVHILHARTNAFKSSFVPSLYLYGTTYPMKH